MIGQAYALRIIGSLALILLIASAGAPASAAGDYPNHTIKIVVPVPPGGAADVVPRLVAEKLASRWGHPVIVENRPGAALNLGAEVVAKAEPDGYTLLATPPGPLVTNQFLSPHLGFDPGAFVPVTILATHPFALVVRSSLPVSSLQDLIAYAKANPDKLNFASSGIGSPPHLAMEMLKAKAGIRMVHVPYKGLVPALTDVVAGHVDMMFHNSGDVLPHIKAGQLKALGVGSAARVPELPDVPPIGDVLNGFVATTWFAIVAPPKTPDEIAAKLSNAMAVVLRLPDVAQRLRDYSITPVGSTSPETAAFLKTETDRWREVVVAAGLKPGRG